jgi:hypothetical protein
VTDDGWHRDSPDLTDVQRAILRREDEAEAALEAERRASGKQCIFTNGTICVHERKNPNTPCDGVTKCCALRDDGDPLTGDAPKPPPDPPKLGQLQLFGDLDGPAAAPRRRGKRR